MFLWLIKSNISSSDMFCSNLSFVFLTFMLHKFEKGEEEEGKT